MLHFTSSSFLVAATSYLLGDLKAATDAQLSHAGAFALWLHETYPAPQHVRDWREALEAFERDGGEDGWRETTDARRAEREEREAVRASGITWQPGAREAILSA